MQHGLRRGDQHPLAVRARLNDRVAVDDQAVIAVTPCREQQRHRRPRRRIGGAARADIRGKGVALPGHGHLHRVWPRVIGHRQDVRGGTTLRDRVAEVV